MRYLKTYEDHSWQVASIAKQQIINQVNQTIDDAMLSLCDEGFEEIKSSIHGAGEGGGSYDIFKKYVRDRSSVGVIKLNGEINDGVIDWSDDEYEHFDHDIVQEFINSLNLMQGVSGIDIKFSFTNFLDDDKILIYTNV